MEVVEVFKDIFIILVSLRRLETVTVIVVGTLKGIFMTVVVVV